MKTKNLAVGILCAVLLVALWWTMLLKPTRTKVSKVRADTAAQEAKLAPLQAQLARARRDAAHAAEFQAQLQSLQQAMPNSPALAAFIRQANQIAAASGVSWQSVTHAPPVPGVGGLTSISIGIQIQGTYPQVMDYMARLAALRRLVVVDNLQLSTTTQSTGAGGGGTSGASTGPFSGGNELSATITARMFASPGALATGDATGASTASGTSSSNPPVNASTPTNG